uniref:Autophagy protein 5 n=1 Tax=Strigamia maritima TaxID=126957 RepID=T1JM08_STRMM
MADDREILREMWDGSLPVCFHLAREEVHGMQQPDPCYLLVPRQSYFPLVIDKVKKHFARFIQPDLQNEELWLETSGIPLKLHYPIGVLFDLLAYDVVLPWNLTVRYQNFPDDESLKLSTDAAVESFFMSTVKEANALKHRMQIMNDMQKKDYNQLWLGLLHYKFDQFWAINRKLMDRSCDEFFKYIPFRIYQSDLSYTQKLFKPIGTSKELHTLLDLIKTVIDLEETNRIIIQGIEVPSKTPIQWLSEHFSYPDNFLHICIVPKT